MQRKIYTKQDFLEHYEDRRFTLPFMVFKVVDYWPIFDQIALYGHFFPNFIVVICAIHFNVSFFMGFNIACICTFYTVSILRLQARAAKNFRLSGMLQQTDLNNACATTKQFKIGGFYEFLTAR